MVRVRLSDGQILNSLDPDQMHHFVASDLHL